MATRQRCHMYSLSAYLVQYVDTFITISILFFLKYDSQIIDLIGDWIYWIGISFHFIHV